MKQRFFIFILVFCLSMPLAAQPIHEFSVNAGGGWSGLNYTPVAGKYTAGIGGEFGLGYHLFFNSQWGIGTGFNLAFYNSKTTMGNYSGRTPAMTNAGNAFDFSYAYSGYEEANAATMLTIPLLVQFQYALSKPIALYAAGGGKFGFPLSASNRISGDLSTNAYLPGTNVTYSNDLPSIGFGDYKIHQENNLDLGVAIMLSLEVGTKWNINESMHLYTGIYMDYGVNNINKTETNGLLNYKSAPSYPEGYTYNSVATASDKIAPLAIGLKLRFSFSLSPVKGNQ